MPAGNPGPLNRQTWQKRVLLYLPADLAARLFSACLLAMLLALMFVLARLILAF